MSLNDIKERDDQYNVCCNVLMTRDLEFYHTCMEGRICLNDGVFGVVPHLLNGNVFDAVGAKLCATDSKVPPVVVLGELYVNCVTRILHMRRPLHCSLWLQVELRLEQVEYIRCQNIKTNGIGNLFKHMWE